MSEHDLEKLLGGFAADTLTPEEKQALYAAALQDQQLFTALADEQAFKELLADPDVRRRLLASLQEKTASSTGGSLSWLDWFRRPTGLAIAGGLSAAALAVVLGVRIYQDSLRNAAQSIATEDAKPASPSAPMPPVSHPPTPEDVELQAKAKENLAPAMDRQKKDSSTDQPAMQQRPMPPPSKRERASDVSRDNLKQRRPQDEVSSHAEAPVGALSKSAEEAPSPSDRKLAASSAQPAATPEPKQLQPPAGGRVTATATQALGARALFYGEEPGRADTRSMAREQEQAMKPLAESTPQANRIERKSEGLSQLGKAAGTVAHFRPLGLRYSFVVRVADGQEREVDGATASKSAEPVHLTVEVNQDAYLQIWETAGSSTPRLLWPDKESGQTSLKITAGQRQHIPLSMGSGSATLTVRLSQVPSGSITRQEIGMLDKLSPNQVQESITASSRTGSQEHATYVVNPDPSTAAQIAVNITMSQ
jgi:hypothetical protein